MNESDENNIIVIFDNTLSTTKSILAALLYTLTFGIVIFYFYFLYISRINEGSLNTIPHFIGAFCFCLAASVHFSKVSIVKIDKIKKLVYMTTNIVFYKKTKVIEAIEFEYVALYEKNFNYVISLWYKKNRHFVILNFNKKNKAELYAKSLCKELNIDLLDRTSGKPVWIENAEL